MTTPPTIYLTSEPYGSRKRWTAVDEKGFPFQWGFTKKKVVEWIQYQESCGHCRYGGEKR